MNIQYDKVADAMYVKLSTAKVAKTVEISDNLIADLDAQGNTIGIEMLDVSSQPDIAETLQQSVMHGLPVSIKEETPALH